MEKVFIEPQLAKRLFASEAQVDDALADAAELMSVILAARQDPQGAAAFTDDVQVRLMEAMRALSEARSAMSAVNAELAEVTKSLGTKVSRPAETITFKTATDDLLVRLPSIAVETLRPRTTRVGKIMEVLSEHIVESRERGHSTGFVVEIDPTGEPTIRASIEPADAEADLEVSLEAARERGRLRVAEILSDKDMLSAENFAALLGVSRVTVNAKRTRHEVLGLDGAKRGFRFPAWQIDRDGKPFAAIPQLFQVLGESPWTVYRFIVQRHPELGGKSGLQALRDGQSRELLEAADSVARGALN